MRRIVLCFWLAALLAPPAFSAQQIVTAQAATQPVTLTGFTRARTVIDLSSEEAGKVMRVFADIGEPIAETGYFACLDPTFIDLDIRGNQADLARVKIEIDFFVKQTARYRTLVQQNSSAQMQLDEIERSLATFQRQFDALHVKEARLQERKQRLCITAPPGSLVIDRSIEQGEWLDIGQSVGRVGDFSSLLIPYALSLAEYQVLLAVQQLTVRLPDLDKSVAASIERVSPDFDEQSHKIRLDLQIADNGVRGGLRAQLMLNVPDTSGAVLVAEAALQERYEQFWLHNVNGQEVRVVYLGPAESGTADGKQLVRVVSPDVRPGDRFFLDRR